MFHWGFFLFLFRIFAKKKNKLDICKVQYVKTFLRKMCVTKFRLLKLGGCMARGGKIKFSTKLNHLPRTIYPPGFMSPTLATCCSVLW